MYSSSLSIQKYDNISTKFRAVDVRERKKKENLSPPTSSMRDLADVDTSTLSFSQSAFILVA